MGRGGLGSFAGLNGSCYDRLMDTDDRYDHILIREAAILVRVPHGCREQGEEVNAEFFDVRTGVQLRAIYPDLQDYELCRGYLISGEGAAAILRSGTGIRMDPSADHAKVVTILEAKQRKLDSVVSDSILDQIRVIERLLREFLRVADGAQREERFWLAQQALSLVRKFSGRELAELEEIVEWFKTRTPRK